MLNPLAVHLVCLFFYPSYMARCCTHAITVSALTFDSPGNGGMEKLAGRVSARSRDMCTWAELLPNDCRWINWKLTVHLRTPRLIQETSFWKRWGKQKSHLLASFCACALSPSLQLKWEPTTCTHPIRVHLSDDSRTVPQAMTADKLPSLHGWKHIHTVEFCTGATCTDGATCAMYLELI